MVKKKAAKNKVVKKKAAKKTTIKKAKKKAVKKKVVKNKAAKKKIKKKVAKKSKKTATNKPVEKKVSETDLSTKTKKYVRNVLTDEVAKKWLRNQYLDIDSYTELGCKAAETLLSMWPADLDPGWHLDGEHDLPQELNLNGLVQLSTDEAAFLSQCPVLYLSLEGLSLLEGDAAEKLFCFRGQKIVLGLEKLTPEIAKAFCNFKESTDYDTLWGSIDLSKVTNLDDETTKAMEGFKGHLSLRSLKTIPLLAAHIIANRYDEAEGSTYELNLSSTAITSNDIAAALAEGKCCLNIHGFSKLSKDIQKTLMQNEHVKLNKKNWT